MGEFGAPQSERFRSPPRTCGRFRGILSRSKLAQRVPGGEPMLDTTRREFIALIGGGCLLLAVKVKRAWGQQPAIPVIGFLAEGTPASEPGALTAFRQGLREAGYVEGQNVQIDYRWSGEQRDLLLALTADLVRRNVTVIYSARGSAVAQSAKAATTSIPIVFTNGGDPIKLGLVASLNRPGGNVIGTTFFSNVLTAK